MYANTAVTNGGISSSTNMPNNFSSNGSGHSRRKIVSRGGNEGEENNTGTRRDRSNQSSE